MPLAMVQMHATARERAQEKIFQHNNGFMASCHDSHSTNKLSVPSQFVDSAPYQHFELHKTLT